MDTKEIIECIQNDTYREKRMGCSQTIIMGDLITVLKDLNRRTSNHIFLIIMTQLTLIIFMFGHTMGWM